MTDTREFVTSPNCPGVISQTPFLPAFNDLLNFGVQRSDGFRTEPEHSSGQWFSLHFVWKWLTQTPFSRVIRTEFSPSWNRHLQRVFLSTSHSSRSHDSPSWPIKDRLMCFCNGGASSAWDWGNSQVRDRFPLPAILPQMMHRHYKKAARNSPGKIPCIICVLLLGGSKQRQICLTLLSLIFQ